MILGDGLVGIALFILWVFCIVDVIQTPDGEVRHLPKFVWLILVIVLLDVGSIAWLAAGRPRASATRGQRHPHATAFPEYDRPGRFAATNPDDDAEFLQQVRRRAEEQRRLAAEQRRIAEQREADDRERRRRAGEPEV